MDQELKQRLIGAAVITALAAIFVPMLFDDPIDESVKNVSELKIPDLPSKAQDAEIMILPEKVEDVATLKPANQPPQPVVLEEDDEVAMEAPRQQVQITAKDTAVTPPPAKWVEPEEDMQVAEEDVEPPAVIEIPSKPQKQSAPVVAVPEPAVVNKKPTTPPSVNKTTVAAENAATRLYLNVGTFSQKVNATSLSDSLKQQGFAVSVKEVASDKGLVFKVRVGPMLDRATAQSVKSKLAQINVNSFVSGDE